MDDHVALLSSAYAPLLALSDRLAGGSGGASDPDEATGWRPTDLPGWTVRDLVLHLAGDAQRALVALHTPAPGPVDTDDVSYWWGWTPGTDDVATGLRATRAVASQWASVRGPADLHRHTARAVLHAVAGVDPTARVATQGHVLIVESLLSTLVVEAAVHTLDLGAVVPEGPSPAALGEVRRVTAAMLGSPVPTGFDDVRWARLATGRAVPTAAELAALGAAAGRVPLFG